MPSLKDEIADISAAATKRRRDALTDAAEELAAEHRPQVVAHLAFGYLHLALAIVAQELTRHGHAVKLVVFGGGNLSLTLGGQMTVARFFLTQTEIAVEFLGDGHSEETWAPEDPDGSALYAEALSVATRAAKYLLRAP